MELGSTWDVDSYERGRPPYPAEAIDLLVSELGVDRSATVLDLGAGNGRLTRALAGRFARVIAVEPHAEMRARIAVGSPAAEVLDGTAEAIPLAAESIDAVFVGSAFHWFDQSRAVPEIARVLRPRGGLGITASRWARDTSEWAMEIDGVLGRHGSDPAAGWRDRFAATDQFEPLAEALVDGRPGVGSGRCPRPRCVDQLHRRACGARAPPGARRGRAHPRYPPAGPHREHAPDAAPDRALLDPQALEGH